MKNNIGQLMEETNTSLKKLSRITGRTEKYLQKVINNLSEPGIALVAKLLLYFDKDFDEVFIREEKEAW